MIVSATELKTALGGSYASAADETVAQGARIAAERLVKNYVGYNIEQRSHTEYYPPRSAYDQAEVQIDGYEAVGQLAVPYSRELYGSEILQLRNLPVRSVASVYENPAAWETAGGDWPANTLLTQGPDYHPDYEEPGLSWTGFLHRRGRWGLVARCVKVTYTAGLSVAELKDGGGYEEFRIAVIQTAIKLFNEMKQQQAFAAGEGSTGPVQSEHLADWSISYAVSASQQANSGFSRGLPVSAARILEHRVRMTKFLDG